MEQNLLVATIDGHQVVVPEGSTILDACEQLGVRVPTLCYMEDISSNGSCGVCVVEVKGARSLVRSCMTKVVDEMEITTNNTRVQEARRANVELLLANHEQNCLFCSRNETCELQEIAYSMGIREKRFYQTRNYSGSHDATSPSLIRNYDKCILCGRCVDVCANVQTVKAINFTGRGGRSKIGTFMDAGLGNVACTFCGQCALVCPTAGITEKSMVDPVWGALHDKERIVLVQTAPAIRVGIGEAMGMPYGSLVTGQMVAGLRRLGFDKVFDTQFTADLTIMEEGNELIQRLTKGGTLPMITSCSPGWIKFIEHFYPQSLKHLSTCKSPQQMFGSIAKTYYAEKMNIDPRKLTVVSIMPCTAKKYEAQRPEMHAAFDYWKTKMDLKEGEFFFDVDYVLTTRELALMFKEAGIDIKNIHEENFDSPLGASSGAAVIFGATGGVMEAALRTAYEVVTGKSLPAIDFISVRGMEGIREAEVDLDGTKLKVAVAHTLKNARKILDQIEEGKSQYAFIEVMTCPGGCLGGGGSPIPTNKEIRAKRAASIYKEDIHKGIRKSHENIEIQALYKEFLEKPLGHRSHQLLHTTYVQRGVY